MNDCQFRSVIRSLILLQKTEGRNTRRQRTDGRWQNGLKVRAVGREGPRAVTGGRHAGHRRAEQRGVGTASKGGERAIGQVATARRRQLNT